jgi:large subunit ribosomal protein L9
MNAVRQRVEAADRVAREAIEMAEENAAMLSRTVLTISQQAGDDGRLFGSVTSQDIVDAIKEARGLKLDRRGVHLEDPIKNVGTYMVVVEVAGGTTATIKTIVSAAK